MKKLILSASIILAMFALGACSKSARLPQQGVVVKQENGETEKKARLVLGDVMLLELGGSYESGFIWDLKPLPEDVSALALVEVRYNQSGKGASVPGVFTFVMRTIHVGSQTLEFAYRHQAEKNKPPEKTFTLHMKIE